MNDSIREQADAVWQQQSRDDRHAAQQDLSPKGSEDWLALEFARRHHLGLRHVAATGQWLIWNGHRWAEDRTTVMYDLVRPIVREFAATLDGDTPKARKAATAAIVAGVERLARSDRRLAATIEQWDAEPFSLNTPGGIVDLRTGILRPSDPLAYCTKVTAVAPAEAGTPAPLWDRFLHRITNGNRDLIEFHQRMAGLSLTGDTSEHAIFFGYGTGANGKGVEINTYRDLLADYATTAPAEIFLVSRTDRHPTEIAGLRGARLVIVSEVDKGRRWNEARLKSFTGGDPLKGRFMRQDFFEFRPQFKLLIVGNHKPRLRSVDEAFSRRFHMLPFTVTIPRAERDRGLSEKLKAEYPAILRWMIDGCLIWQRSGLEPPAIVTSTTQEYLASEDAISQWLEEWFVKDVDGWTSSADLMASWKMWAERSGEYVGSKMDLADSLEARQFVSKRGTGGTRGFRGLRLKTS